MAENDFDPGGIGTDTPPSPFVDTGGGGLGGSTTDPNFQNYINTRQQQVNAYNQQNGPYVLTMDGMGNVSQVPNPNFNSSSRTPNLPGLNSGGGGGMTDYQSALIQDARNKLTEQQREFDLKQSQELQQFMQQQHTEQERLQFQRDQEQNKVQFQYAQLAQTQQHFEQQLGWDRTKFYTEFGLNVTREQDDTIMKYRESLQKEQSSPRDLVAYLYNSRGYTAPAGGQSTAMPLPPSVLDAYRDQGLQLPQAYQGVGQGGSQYQQLGTLPYGFGGGAGNLNQNPPPLPGTNNVATPLGSQNNMLNNLIGYGKQMGGDNLRAQSPLLRQDQISPLGNIPATNLLNQLNGQNNMTATSPLRQQGIAPQAPQASNFNVWDYLPPQLKGFFGPSQNNVPNIPGTSSQPKALIPSMQMYNQLTPTERGTLESFQNQQLGILPDDMKSMMEQNAPIPTGNLSPGTFR